MQVQLDPIQLRVLGALIEKEIATPENYPLSLNALVNACNQKSSRDPVLELAEEEVRQALHSLEDLALVAPVHDGRVPKYEHRIRTVLNLRRDETAVLCLLLLRGPQTPGELRSRADRLYSFDDLGAVQATLERLAARDASAEGSASGPLTMVLPRQPGSREARYAHLLGGQPGLAHRAAASDGARGEAQGDGAGSSDSGTDRLRRMEEELAALGETVRALQTRVERLESERPTPAGEASVSLASSDTLHL